MCAEPGPQSADRSPRLLGRVRSAQVRAAELRVDAGPAGTAATTPEWVARHRQPSRPRRPRAGPEPARRPVPRTASGRPRTTAPGQHPLRAHRPPARPDFPDQRRPAPTSPARRDTERSTIRMDLLASTARRHGRGPATAAPAPLGPDPRASRRPDRGRAPARTPLPRGPSACPRDRQGYGDHRRRGRRLPRHRPSGSMTATGPLTAPHLTRGIPATARGPAPAHPPSGANAP